jgi:hypothetical protein
MSKRQFVFHWQDTPRYAGPVSRKEVAELFRNYRKRRSLYLLYRLRPGVYHVSLNGYRAIGVFTALATVQLVSEKESING